MAPFKAEVALDHCHKSTVFGNKVSIHMLEFLSTIKTHPPGFDQLAHEFLDVCRIMWSVEAGLNECTRTKQELPGDMLQELDKKFRIAHSDFQLLDQWLNKFLEYERRGTVGKIQRGWRKIFTDSDIEKMRGSMGKTSEALKMSSLIFQWSLGDTKIDESVGMGYTGLAAALDRMDRGKSVVGIIKLKSLEPYMRSMADEAHSVDQPPPVLELGRVSTVDLSPSDTRNSHSSQSFSVMNRPGSGSPLTVSSRGIRERNLSTTDVLDMATLPGDRSSGGTTKTLIGEDDEEIGPFKIVSLKADPETMPRWSPRNTVGADAPALKEALISAVEARNSKLVKQLLDRGVLPDTSPEAHPLNEAVHNHDIEVVRLLLLFGADPNEADNDGLTPLCAAVQDSFFDGASMLLKYGADPNLHAGPEPESPLALSIAEDKSNFTLLLFMYGGDANHTMADGDTVLIKAISKKQTNTAIELMLEYGSDPNGKNREGKTPLFEAIQTGRVDIVSTLLNRGADPNLPGPKHMLWPATYHPACLQVLLARGAKPQNAPGVMELATSINNLESVRILLNAGVDPNAKKDGVYTPLCTSIRDDRHDIFEVLLASGADPNLAASEFPAFKCVTHSRTHFLAPLVAAGADLHTPKGILEVAVECKNVKALNWLLDAGVSPNDKAPKTGATPLTTAIRDNQPELVDLLLQRGADPTVRGHDWPICMAVRQPAILKRLLPALAEPRAFKGVMEMAVVANELESVKLLLGAGVSVEDRNGGVFSPLTTAIREGHRHIVRFLLDEAGADPNAPGEHLPVVKALCHLGEDGDTAILEMVLAKGADPNLVYRGHNAIIQAMENGDVGVLKLLVDRCGVDLEARDDSGMTVLEIASSRGWDEAREILENGKKVETE